MDFGDLDSTAAHDTARATAMTAHPSSRMSIVCSGGKASTCNDCDDPHLVDAEGQKRAYLMDA